MVAQAVDGIQFWDLSDPLNINLINYMNVPGIDQGDYSGNWWTFWQAPYVYIAGQGSGLYVGGPPVFGRMPCLFRLRSWWV